MSMTASPQNMGARPKVRYNTELYERLAEHVAAFVPDVARRSMFGSPALWGRAPDGRLRLR